MDEALVNLLVPEISGNSFTSTELRRFGSSEGGRRKSRELEVTAPGCTFSLRWVWTPFMQIRKLAIHEIGYGHYHCCGDQQHTWFSGGFQIKSITGHRHHHTDASRSRLPPIYRCSGQRIVGAYNFVSNLRKLRLGRKLTRQSYRCFNHPSMLPNQYAYNARIDQR